MGIEDLGYLCGAVDREEDEKGRKLERKGMGERGKEIVQMKEWGFLKVEIF